MTRQRAGLDLRILLTTLWKVLVTREGLHAADGAKGDALVNSEGSLPGA